jgi:hypothetical protein
VWSANAFQRELEVELHIERVTPVLLRRQSREPSRQVLVAFGWWIQLPLKAGEHAGGAVRVYSLTGNNI